MLRDAGADEAMAEAIVNTASAAAGAGHDMLATKADIAVLKADIVRLEAATKADLAELRADLYRALWIQGGALAALILAARLL